MAEPYEGLSPEACRRELRNAYRKTVERCRLLRKQVVARKAATEEEIDAVWPVELPDDLESMSRDELLALARDHEVEVEGTGARGRVLVDDLLRDLASARPTLDQWLYAYGNLRFYHGRSSTREPDRAVAEEVALRAQRSEPERVAYLGGSYLEVWPKSTDSLLWYQGRDFEVGHWRERYEILRDGLLRGEFSAEEVPDPHGLLERVEGRISWMLSVLCFASCEPGPRVDRARRLWTAGDDPPALFREMDPISQKEILGAFRYVNIGRLTYLGPLVAPPKPGKKDRPGSWNVFHATIATKLGIPVEESIRDRDLASQLAQLRLGTPSLDDLDS